jgi:hypothetical protein
LVVWPEIVHRACPYVCHPPAFQLLLPALSRQLAKSQLLEIQPASQLRLHRACSGACLFLFQKESKMLRLRLQARLPDLPRQLAVMPRL